MFRTRRKIMGIGKLVVLDILTTRHNLPIDKLYPKSEYNRLSVSSLEECNRCLLSVENQIRQVVIIR